MIPPFALPIAASTAAIKFIFKPIKYFFDSNFRPKVTPVPGSVLYCDLFWAVEHSGIHVVGDDIANIEVGSLAESIVRLANPHSFTNKSKYSRKIYVSSNSQGAVGSQQVANHANTRVGEQGFYGLVIKNCHQFSTQCVNTADSQESSSSLFNFSLNETWEPTIRLLKSTAKWKLGATKWLLWDWQNDEQADPEPDWDELKRQLQNQELTPDTIKQLRHELAEVLEYEQETADENIPETAWKQFIGMRQQLESIDECYRKHEAFILANSGAGFSYLDLQNTNENLNALAKLMKNNPAIRGLAHKMGRNYISEEKKQQTRIPQASQSEIHGTRHSADLMRMLPSELVNLEDPDLETLFYARLLEQNLLTYELSGTQSVAGETTEEEQQRTGPVVACLDTSGSMKGTPSLKAKALLLTIAGILKEEDRSLHVILFSNANQTREYSMVGENKAASLLKFLQQEFGGGTNFESPLRKAVGIIDKQKNYKKADILMISDGDCSLTNTFTEWLAAQKNRQDSSIYTVLCAGSRSKDSFSDEIITL